METDCNPKQLNFQGLGSRKVVADFEKQYLIQVLEKANGVIKEAAGLAGMHTKNFHEKLIRYNIQPKKNFI